MVLVQKHWSATVMLAGKELVVIVVRINQRKASGCQLMLTKLWAVEHNIERSVFITCSAAHAILENQLTVT